MVDLSGVSSLCSFRHDTMATTTKLVKTGRRREWAVLAEAGAARERRVWRQGPDLRRHGFRLPKLVIRISTKPLINCDNIPFIDTE